MLHIGFSRELAKINFKDRATIRDGRVTYRLADGSGNVGLDAAEWRALIAEFDEKSGQVLRKAKRCLVLLLPAVLAYALTLGQVMPGGGLIIVAALFLGPPAVYLWQSHRIERIGRRMEEGLAGRAKVAAPRRAPWRVPRWLEIACAMLVGPHLILEAYGSLNPEAYRNTPLLGTELDWTSLISFSVLVAVLYLRRQGEQQRTHPSHVRQGAEPERPVGRDGPAPRTFGRRVDPVARARETPR